MDKCFNNQEFIRLGGRWLGGREPASPVERIETDSRRDCADSLFLALRGENFDGHDFLAQATGGGAAALCVDKKFDAARTPENIPILQVDDTLDFYQKLGNLRRDSVPGLKLVGVTGSSGKTSVKEMLRAIMSEAYGETEVLATEANTNNHIGVPQNLLRLRPEHKIAIIEMGTNHPGEIAVLEKIAEPDAAIVSCVGNCHLEALGDLNGVAREKAAIYAGLRQRRGVALIPADSPETEVLEKACGGCRILRFGKNPENDVSYQYLGGTLNESKFRLRWPDGETETIEWSLPGAHQAANAAGAAGVAEAFGVPRRQVAAGLRHCRLPGMRSRISRIDGVSWINDAYNANPDSVKSGLEWLAGIELPGKLVLALGDMLEIGDTAVEKHRQVLNHALKMLPRAEIVAIGPVMRQAGEGMKANVSFAPNAAAAVDIVRGKAEPEATIFIKASRGTGLEVIEPG